MGKVRGLVHLSLLVLCLLFLLAPCALADNIAVSNAPTTPCSGGVICQGGAPIDLSEVLNGTFKLNIPANGTPQWELVNNLGKNYNNGGTITDASGKLTQLTLFYTGTLASNATLDLQVNGWSATTIPFSGCEIIDSSAPTSNTTTGCSVNTLDAMQGFKLPAELIWSIGSDFGVGANGYFDIQTSSFAHAGQDVGCLSGTASCTVSPVPEPSSTSLLAAGLFVMIGLAIWRKA
jgi:hypothetical protein